MKATGRDGTQKREELVNMRPARIFPATPESSVEDKRRRDNGFKKRRLRAGVQAEGHSRAFVLTFRFQQKRGEVLARMGRQVS